MKKIDQIFESLYNRVIEPCEAKEQLLNLLVSDEEIKKYFSTCYGGDAGSAVYGAKWVKNTIIEELK